MYVAASSAESERVSFGINRAAFDPWIDRTPSPRNGHGNGSQFMEVGKECVLKPGAQLALDKQLLQVLPI